MDWRAMFPLPIRERQEALMHSCQAMANALKRIGLISDTTAYCARKQWGLARRSDHSRGGRGEGGILEALKKIRAGCSGARNVDTEPWAQGLPETAVTEAGAATIYVCTM